MGYVKTNWQTGDIVTSAKMNNIENGIANNDKVFVVHGVGSFPEPDGFSEILLSTYACDCTVRDIINALEDGKLVIVTCSLENTDINSYQKSIYVGLVQYQTQTDENDNQTAYMIACSNNDIPYSGFFESDLDNPMIFGYDCYRESFVDSGEAN